MKALTSYLAECYDLGSTLFYPGSGSDFQPMKTFLENSSINTVYYIDYGITINSSDVMAALGIDWTLVEESKIYPKHFEQTEWADFWYNVNLVDSELGPNNAYGFKLWVVNKDDKKCNFTFLRTEAIKSFLILFSKKDKDIRPDLIVLQDHGFGGQWGGQVFGYTEDEKSKFYRLNKVRGNSLMPPYLYIAENTNPWPEYKQLTAFEGNYGSAGHPRALFKLEE